MSRSQKPSEELIDTRCSRTSRRFTWTNLHCYSIQRIHRREPILIRHVIAGKKRYAAFERLLLQKVADGGAFRGRMQTHLDDHLPARENEILQTPGEVFYEGKT